MEEEILMEEMEVPTQLEVFLAVIQKQGKSESLGSVHSVTVRIPTMEFATIEAITRMSGLARNKVIVDLLRVAIEQTWQGVDPVAHDVLSNLSGSICADLVQGDQGKIKILEQSQVGEI